MSKNFLTSHQSVSTHLGMQYSNAFTMVYSSVQAAVSRLIIRLAPAVVQYSFSA